MTMRADNICDQRSVKFEIRQNVRSDTSARRLISATSTGSVQHEFGLFRRQAITDLLLQTSGSVIATVTPWS
jgi:hypothetical protein